MSRNHEEDWERRKTYLIRSLFRDMPLLSPVLEDPETRSHLGSPSGVPPSRPHSPLPPLIIERVPNRHDHPDQYYKDLEIKMKKLYRKLFHNEESSSIENLSDKQSLIITNYTEKSASSNSEQGSVDDNLVTAEAPKTALSESSSSISTEGDNRIGQSSTESEEIRIRDEIDEEMQRIHKSTDEEVQISPVYEGDDISKSPILGSSQFNIRVQTVSLSSGNLCSGTNDSKSETEEKYYENTASDITLESIEIMRRQRGVSSSLGSLQGEHIKCTTGSSISFTSMDNRRKRSFQIDTDFESSDAENSNAVDVQENIFTHEIPLEILTTPNLSSESKILSISKRQNIGLPVYQTQSFIKRKKFENIATQTSDTEETSWDNLKNNLFVGAAKIYKLCSCKDHNC